MEQDEIQERSKQIALMLGFKYRNQSKAWARYPLDNGSFLSLKGWLSMKHLKFHSDWNWLMEVVEFIESKGYATQISHDYTISNYGCDYCEINTVDNALLYDDREPIVSILNKSKKSIVFIAVSDFAKLYNEKKL